MKLRYLLIASFVVAASVPLFFALTYVNVDLANRYRQQKIEQLDGIATIAERRMDSALDRIEACTTMFINRQSVRDALAGLPGHDGEIDQATYQSIKAAIDETAGSLADINGIFVLDASGNVVASTGVTGDLGRDHVVESDLIESMIHVNGPGIDLKLLPLNNSIGILSRYTLRNDADQPCGHVAVLFDGAFIVDTVADRTGLGRTGEWLFAVANDDGSATFAVPLKYDKLAAFNRTIPANRPDVPIIQAIRGNETIMENAPDYREAPVIAATRYIDRQGWGLVAKIDQAEILEPFHAAKFMLVTLEVVLVTVSMLVGVILSHMIAHPVENLRDVTQTISSGDLNRRAEIKGWGEVRDLSSSFNQMADSIVELTDGLNDTVEQRTAELAQANAELAEMATTDALTGLANRRAFMEHLHTEFNRAKRYGEGMALVLLDIDHFKLINDQHGHPTGDRALVAIGQCLQRTCRNTDVVARIGGEEFAMILPHDATQAIQFFTERLRLEIAGLIVENDGRNEVSITASLGIAHYDESVASVDILFAQADRALYAAKQAGRNKVCIFHPDHDNEADRFPIAA